MNDGLSGSAIAAFFAKYGASAGFGMIGAALLYVVLPPVKPVENGKPEFSGKEFVLRLAVAGVFSVIFGDMAADALTHVAPWLNPWKNKSAVDLMTGAPGWWLSRAVALAMYNTRNKDILQIANRIRTK